MEQISEKEVFVLFLLLLQGYPEVTFVAFCLITDMNTFITVSLVSRAILLYQEFTWFTIIQVVILILCVEVGKSEPEYDDDEHEQQSELGSFEDSEDWIVDSVSNHYVWQYDRLRTVRRDRVWHYALTST